MYIYIYIYIYIYSGYTVILSHIIVFPPIAPPDVNNIMFVCVTLLIAFWFIFHLIHIIFKNENVASYYLLEVSHFM